jgi:hypothetical protein
MPDLSTITAGQVVRVYCFGRVGQRDRTLRGTVSRVTPTQLVLKDGARFMRSSGLRVAALACCERRDRITEVL